MTTSYATLTTPVTQAQYLSQILATLAAQGFPVTAWQAGNAGRTLATADAAALADLRAVIADVARGGYLDTSTGDWLTLLAAGLFDLTRTAAVYAVGNVTLSCVATAGPYNITAGALVVTDGTRRWRSTNTTTRVVPSGGSVVVEVRAESPGTAHNGSGSLLLTTPVSPALAGVTVTAAGFPAPTYSISAGTLPSGLALDATTGIISGTPAAGTGASYALTIKAQADAQLLGRPNDELSHAELHARGNHKVFGLVLLQHHPLHAHVVFGVAPVTQCVNVTHVKTSV